MTLENGSLILADYTAKIKDTGQIIDTTRKEDAEKAGNADPTRDYEPRLIAVGEGWVLKGLDEALQKADANQTLDIELTPDKAFGVRDPNRVSRIPIKKFGEKAAELEVGAEIEVDNRVGVVRSVESGRVLIDFNHKYAGKTLQYNLEIKQKLDERNQQVEALIRRRLPIEKEKVKFEAIGESEVKITIPSDYFLLDGLQIIKRGISTDLFKFIKPLDKVSFIEEYENPAKKEAEVKKQEEEKKESPKAEITPPPPEASPPEAPSPTTSPAPETKPS